MRLNALEKTTKEFNELRTQLLIKYADAENLRKAREVSRKVAESDQSRKFAKKLSVVADEMLEIAETWKSGPSPVSEGIVMTATAMKHTLGKFDMEVLTPEVGAPVDIKTMEVVGGQADATAGVKKVKKNGWILKGEVLRKADVEVHEGH